MEVFMNGPRNYRKADGIHVSCCKADGGVLRTKVLHGPSGKLLLY